jgi:hypothetical protein
VRLVAAAAGTARTAPADPPDLAGRGPRLPGRAPHGGRQGQRQPVRRRTSHLGGWRIAAAGRAWRSGPGAAVAGPARRPLVPDGAGAAGGEPLRTLDGPRLDALLGLVELQADQAPRLGEGGWDLSWWTAMSRPPSTPGATPPTRSSTSCSDRGPAPHRSEEAAVENEPPPPPRPPPPLRPRIGDRACLAGIIYQLRTGVLGDCCPPA